MEFKASRNIPLLILLGFALWPVPATSAFDMPAVYEPWCAGTDGGDWELYAAPPVPPLARTLDI